MPCAIQAQQRSLWQAEVTSDRLKIFSEVSTPNELVMQLKKGNVVNVVLEVSVLGDRWCRVALPGDANPTGYALCSGLTKVRSAERRDDPIEPVTLTRREKGTAPNPAIETVSEQPQAQPGVLSNQDILTMSNAGLPAGVLVAKIKAGTCSFDTTPRTLQALKTAGIPDSVILAMVEAPVGASPTFADVRSGSSRNAISDPAKVAVAAANLPDEIGVYYRQNGILKAIEPEIVNWQTGGVMKREFTLGIDKGHINGTVVRPHSSLMLSHNDSTSMGVTELYIRCPDGNSASEYQLLRLWEKGDRREFRAVTGGVLHQSGGAKKNLVTFSFEKAGPRFYRIEIPTLPAGEYGLLAPGAVASTNVASQGKIYTFRTE